MLSLKDRVLRVCALMSVVAPGAAVDALAETCVTRGLLCVSGVPEFVETGKVAVALAPNAASDKPQIVVNLAALKRARHALSSQLLSLAKVIQ